MPWTPPNDYKPMPNLSVILLTELKPKVGTATFKIIVMVTHDKTPSEVGMTPAQARSAIEERIVPTGLYPSVLAIALSDQD